MKILRVRCLLILILAAPAFATDGYFSTGYGIKQLGQGGAGVAFPQDSLAAATNPAGMVFVGDRFDLGMTFFRPIRSLHYGQHLADQRSLRCQPPQELFHPGVGLEPSGKSAPVGWGLYFWKWRDEYLLYYPDPIARQHTGWGRPGATVRLADRGL